MPDELIADDVEASESHNDNDNDNGIGNDDDDDDDGDDNELLVDDVEASKRCGAGLHRMQHRSEPGRSFSPVFSSVDDHDCDD